MTGRYPTVFITRKIFFLWSIDHTSRLFFIRYNLISMYFLKPVVLSNLLFLAVLASLVCYVLWNVVLKQLGTVRASNYIYLNPLVTMVASVIILHEKITWITLLGAGCIIFGVYQAEKKNVRVKFVFSLYCYFYVFEGNISKFFLEVFGKLLRESPI